MIGQTKIRVDKTSLEVYSIKSMDNLIELNDLMSEKKFSEVVEYCIGNDLYYTLTNLP